MKKEELNSDIKEIINKLKKKEKICAMVAPSFVVDFDFHTFADRLRAIGFDKVTELTFGAKEVNHFYREFLLKNPNKTYISTACPAIVELVKEKFPNLTPSLIPCVSPMVAMARILKKQYPKHKIIFIGPCYAKKIEAKNNKELYLALTYQEINIILKHFNKKINKNNLFDRFYNDSTKIYPLSGGMAKSMHLKKIIKKDEYLIIDGCSEIEKYFKNINKKIRFIDALFCKGGCIGGPCIISKEPISKRREKIVKYLNFAKKNKTGEKIGLDKYTKGIIFKN